MEAHLVDFRKIASTARSNHELETNKAIEAARVREQRLKEEVDEAASMLKQFVQPLLTKAVEDLAAEGILLEIAENFHPRGYPHEVPSISAVCRGPARKSDGHRFNADTILFEARGQQIEVKNAGSILRSRHKTAIGSGDKVNVAGLVEKAVTIAVASYFKELDEWNTMGLDRR
jgi:Flp pilus assembly CpaE family ATPase